MNRRLPFILSWLSLPLLILVLAGCRRQPDPARAETIVLPPRETLQPGPAVIRGTSVPIVYAPHADPDPLTPWQQEAIFGAAEELMPAGREVWFVLVLLNRGEHWNVEVYYTPDEVKGRLRKGRCIWYGDWIERRHSRDWRLDSEPLRKREAQGQYVQVIDDAAKGRDFDYIGRLSEMPFQPFSGTFSNVPLPLSDKELVAIIDATSRPTPGWLRKETPVHRIEPIGEERDRFRVYYGWLVGMLYGGGWYREVQRSGNGWIVVSGDGMWVS